MRLRSCFTQWALLIVACLNWFGSYDGIAFARDLAGEAKNLDTPAEEVEAEDVSPLMQVVNRELHIAQSLARLSDKEVTALRERLQPVAKQFARLAPKSNGLGNWYGLVPSTFQAILTRTVLNSVKDKNLAQKYRTDVSGRKALREELLTDAFLIRVHNAVGVLSRQREPEKRAVKAQCDWSDACVRRRAGN